MKLIGPKPPLNTMLEPGVAASRDGRIFRRTTGWRDVVRKDGVTVRLHSWTSRCAYCEAEFVIEVTDEGLANSGTLNNRYCSGCKGHVRKRRNRNSFKVDPDWCDLA